MTKKKKILSKSELIQVVENLHNGEEVLSIALKFSVPVGDINQIKKVLEVGSYDPSMDYKLFQQREKTKRAETKFRFMSKECDNISKELSKYRDLTELKRVLVPVGFEIVKESAKEATAVTLASDWHLDEVVDSKSINGLNEFNPEIAKTRVEAYFKYVLRLLNMCRNESKIDRLVVAALGDFITGWIHDDYLDSNSMTPPEAIISAYELWISGLHFLSTEGNLKEIIFLAAVGNHSRITRRRQTKNFVQKSYEYLLYQFLAKWILDNNIKNIKFQLPTGYFNWLEIYGRLIRFHHGEGITYHGGVGGIHIPLRKAIAQWNIAKKADLDCMGHHHQREVSRNYVLNGSLIGYNEYGEFIKADYEPPQQVFFIIHPTYGKTAEFPIILSRPDKFE